jgi:hypothetical protein
MFSEPVPRVCNNGDDGPMLTALLPGFRDVRSALVAGYMWVLGIWLLAAHLWPPLLDPRTVLAPPILVLIDALGATGSLVALSVVCLLVGECTASLVQNWTMRISRKYVERLTPTGAPGRLRRLVRVFRPMSSRSVARIFLKARRVQPLLLPIERAVGDSAEPPAQSADDLALSAIKEVLYLAPRLIIAKPELYAEHTRYLSESAFRDAIVVPLPVLTFSILINTSIQAWIAVPLFGLVLVLDGYLFIQARSQFRTAYSMLAHSIADGTIKAPALSDRLPDSPPQPLPSGAASTS